MRATELDDGTLALGVAGERPLIELRGDSSAPRLNRRAPGLYHLAILVPTRLDLAFALARLAQERWPLDGASDHLVSEALYLSDPDGNGIEIYRDRPRADWPRAGGRAPDGDAAARPRQRARRASLGRRASGSPLRRGPRIGHVHLQVADLAQAEAFYHGVLGFDVMVRGFPGALFVSAGGYHHHIGLNTWHSAGAGPAEPGSVGLRSFEVTLPSAEALEQTLARVRSAGVETELADGRTLVRHPFGNSVILTAA